MSAPEGCRCGASSSASNRRCECSFEDDNETDPLWTDFETCAQAVTVLFRESHWQNLQSAAAATTQLYKSGLDAQRRGFEKGYQAGRQSLAKEVFGTFSPKFDMNVLLELLSKNLGAEEQRRARESANNVRIFHKRASPPAATDSNAAFHLFHQQPDVVPLSQSRLEQLLRAPDPASQEASSLAAFTK